MAKDSFSEDELTILANEILNDPTFDQFLCEPSSNSSSLHSYSSTNTIPNYSLNISLSAPLIDEELTVSVSDSNNDTIPKHSFSQSTSLYTASKSIHLSNENTNVNIDLSNCISPITKRSKSNKLKNKRSKSSLFIKQTKNNKNTKIIKTDFDIYNNRTCKLKDLIREIFSSNISESQTARNALILCHNSFISSCNLLIELRRIFCMNISEMTYTMFKFDSFPTDYFIRLKITKCICYWIRNYWSDDFLFNNELKKQIESFKCDINRLENKRISNEYINLLNNALKSHTFLLEMDQLSNERVSIKKRFSHLTKLEMCNNLNFELMEFNPIDIAQQLTLLDSKIFNKIQNRECIQQKWKSKNKNICAPNILNMIAQFNDINKWVQITILKANTCKKRKTIIKKMITMASYFMEINNLSSLCAFYNALTSTNIISLHKTWKLLSNKKLKEFENIKQLFGWKMKKFKKIQNELKAPAVPHMGIILEKLFKIEEMYQNKTNSNQLINSIDGVIDCSKMMLLYKEISNVQKLQSKKYEYDPDFLIQKLLITELQLNDKLNQNVLDKLAKDLAKCEQLL